jgi:multicomponent Na+:H+ antiporter subunit F
MSGNFMVAVAGFVMLTVVAGLARILSNPGDADRVLAAQLLGTGGIASLLLVAVARGLPAAIDVALTLAVLCAFVSVTFVKTSVERRGAADGGAGGSINREGDIP